MHRIERWLVARIAVHRGHETTGDAHAVVQYLGHRRQAVGRAGRVRHDHIVRGQRGMVHTIDNGFVRVLAGGRDQHPLGAVFQMRLTGFFRGKDAGAFQHDVHIRPGKISRVADRRDGDGAATDVDAVIGGRNLDGKPAMDRVELQQMGIGFDRTQVVDRHHLDIGASRFNDGAQDVTANPAKSVDGDFDSHDVPSHRKMNGRRYVRSAAPCVSVTANNNICEGKSTGSHAKRIGKMAMWGESRGDHLQKAMYSISSMSFLARNKRCSVP